MIRVGTLKYSLEGCVFALFDALFFVAYVSFFSKFATIIKIVNFDK